MNLVDPYFKQPQRCMLNLPTIHSMRSLVSQVRLTIPLIECDYFLESSEGDQMYVLKAGDKRGVTKKMKKSKK